MKFTLGTIDSGLLVDATNTMYPMRIWGQKNSVQNYDTIGSTYYGFSAIQNCDLLSKETNFTANVPQGHYFCQAGALELKTKGSLIVIERLGFRGLNSIGGPVERSGRLEYIDNCKSTLLINPPRLGDPCLNLLTFPVNTEQNEHTHPTTRSGVISAGSGYCVINNNKYELSVGKYFYLPEGVKHFFISGENGLSVIAFHPDSDWGPTDLCHPMLNRTYLVNKQK